MRFYYRLLVRVSSLCRTVGSGNMEAAACGDSKYAEGWDQESTLLRKDQLLPTLSLLKEQ
jgi:hypothetical protein